MCKAKKPPWCGAAKTRMQHSSQLFLDLHKHVIAAAGSDSTAALAELQNIGYDTFSLDGSLLQQDEIVKQPLVRIVAKANHDWFTQPA